MFNYLERLQTVYIFAYKAHLLCLILFDRARCGQWSVLRWFITIFKLGVVIYYCHLYCWISDELRTPTSNPHTRYSIDAIIRGGKVIMQVDDDKPMMAMFSANSNT